jgi:hypothetical protein
LNHRRILFLKKSFQKNLELIFSPEKTKSQANVNNKSKGKPRLAFFLANWKKWNSKKNLF